MSPRLIIVICALFAIGGFASWYTVHERSIGVAKCEAKNAALVAAQKVHNEEVERRAEVIAAQQIGELKAKLAASPAADAPHLRCLRNDARSAGAVPKDVGPGPDTHAAPEQPAVVSQPDYGPAIDKRFADDDAIIKALQDRIASEIGVCR